MFHRKTQMLLLSTLILLLAACAIPAAEPAPTIDEVEVYAAVIRQVYTVDHTFGEPPNFPNIYLLDTHVADEATADAIVAALADLPAQFTWVTSADEAPRDAHDIVIDGAVINFGPIQPQDDGTLHVDAGIYFAPLGAGGQTYVLENVDGVWTIIGDTGVRWMS